MFVAGPYTLWRAAPQTPTAAGGRLRICAGVIRSEVSFSRAEQSRAWREAILLWPELRDKGLRLEESRPGERARWMLPHGHRPVSLSHATGASVAVWVQPETDESACNRWWIGVDVVAMRDVPSHAGELDNLARTYLGPATARVLAGLSGSHRTMAFALAWTEHEAILKALGGRILSVSRFALSGLTEWSEALGKAIARERACGQSVQLRWPGRDHVATAWMSPAGFDRDTACRQTMHGR